MTSHTKTDLFYNRMIAKQMTKMLCTGYLFIYFFYNRWNLVGTLFPLLTRNMKETGRRRFKDEESAKKFRRPNGKPVCRETVSRWRGAEVISHTWATKLQVELEGIRKVTQCLEELCNKGPECVVKHEKDQRLVNFCTCFTYKSFVTRAKKTES